MANLAFAGKLLYGGVDDIGSLLPADPDCNHNVRASSEAQALGHDKSVHGGHDFLTNNCGDEIRKVFISGIQKNLHASNPGEDAHGYPDFADWPKWNDVTHQKMWVEWIRRAYNGGLRVMVALAVNNVTMAKMVAGPGDGPIDDKASADLQIKEIKQFVSRHPDFMEIAYSSADVDRIVRANKLVVVIGIEVDHIGNLQTAIAGPNGMPMPAPPPTEAAVRAEINRLYTEGVRYIFPIHLLDNAFGTTAVYDPIFNISNIFESGYSWRIECSDAIDSITYTYDNKVDFATAGAMLIKLGKVVIPNPGPNCPDVHHDGKGNRNTHNIGLTTNGRAALNEMMRLGMLIDIDHMSQTAVEDTLKIAEQPPISYPLFSGHNGPREFSSPIRSERSLTSDQYKRIGKLHGMAGVGSGNLDACGWLKLYKQVIQAMEGNVAAGFGTDTNGFAMGMPPPDIYLKSDPQQCINQCQKGLLGKQLIALCVAKCNATFPRTYLRHCTGIYPDQAPSSVQYTSAFPASTDGSKTWNYNIDGVAHYGMLWDFLQDVRSLPGGDVIVDGNLMNGAEYFYRTWQIAEAQRAKVP